MWMKENAVLIDRNCKAVSIFYPMLTVKASITCPEDAHSGLSVEENAYFMSNQKSEVGTIRYRGFRVIFT